MSISITLPTVLAKLAGGNKALTEEVSADGTTVGAVVESLAQRYPALAPRLRDELGKPYPFVVYYLNDENIQLSGGFDASVRDGDEVTLVPAIAGG